MLEERMKAIAEEYGFPYRTSDDGMTYLVECAFEGGRSQLVSGTTLETRDQRMDVIFTLVGPFSDELDLPELLGRQMTWPNARIGILGEDLVVCCPLDPARVGGAEGEAVVEEALQEVSILGDNLEEELFGVDEN